MELLELPFEPASASVARRHVVRVLGARGVDAVTRDDAALIVSELVGNALRHGRAMRGGVLRIRWHFERAHLRVEVTDGGGGRPVLRDHSTTLFANGRGLEIIATLTSAWGFAVDADGTTVWAHVPTESAAMHDPSYEGGGSDDDGGKLGPRRHDLVG